MILAPRPASNLAVASPSPLLPPVTCLLSHPYSEILPVQNLATTLLESVAEDRNDSAIHKDTRHRTQQNVWVPSGANSFTRDAPVPDDSRPTTQRCLNAARWDYFRIPGSSIFLRRRIDFGV